MLLSLVLASAYLDGDTDALSAAAFGAEPELEQAPRTLAVATALTAMEDLAAEARPCLVTVEHADEPAERYLIVSARHAGRLIWSEQYRFDAAARAEAGGRAPGLQQAAASTPVNGAMPHAVFVDVVPAAAVGSDGQRGSEARRRFGSGPLRPSRAQQSRNASRSSARTKPAPAACQASASASPSRP